MLVTTIKHGREVLKRLTSPLRGFPHAWIVLDTETQPREGCVGKKAALIIGRTNIKIITLCHAGESYTFPTSYADSGMPVLAEWLEILVPVFSNRKVVKVFHNANYDINAFRTEGMSLADMRNFWCTLIGAWKANASLEKGLKERAPLYGRKLRKTHNVNFGSLEELALYGEEDVIQTDELYQMQMFGKVRRRHLEFLKEDGSFLYTKPRLPQGTITVPDEDLDEEEKLEVKLQELPYLQCTLRAERRGFPLDVERLRTIRKQLVIDKALALKKIFKIAGKTLNLNSSKQLAVLFKQLGIPVLMATKKGAPSFNAESLFHIQDSHPIVKEIQKYKSLEKLQTVYVGDPASKNPQKRLGLEYYLQPDGTIKASASTVGAVTGRGSSSNPNLTQIPSAKDTYGIKKCFVAA